VTYVGELYKTITYDWCYLREEAAQSFIYGGLSAHVARLPKSKSKGFSLLDLVVTLVIAMLLMTLAIPSYQAFVQRARVAASVADIGELSLAIESFRLRNNDRVPDTLAELGLQVPLDPWGRPYEFLNITAAGPGKGALRKDGRLNPLNTDFDLYSIGRDGKSALPLSAKHSRDDIVRANNGAFIGLGEDY